MKIYQLENYKKVKNEVRSDTWCTDHLNCFRCSFGPGESEKHINKKFERFKYWRRKNFQVVTEAILKNGKRVDLIIFNENDIWIEEIVFSESEESIKKKKENYPFPVFPIFCDENKKF